MTGQEKKPLLLVVEDQVDIREITVQIAEDLGFRVLAAENGRDALAVLDRADALPRIILLDLMMPVMTGWQFIEALQNDARLKSVPVVVMSAVAEEYTTALNVVAHLSKPAIYGDLAGILRRYAVSGSESALMDK